MVVNLSPVGGAAAQFFDNSGNVLTGGKLYTYLAGTTTPAVTYTSNSGLTAHANPIVLNAAGRVPDSGEIWLTDSILYKFVLKDSNDVQIATWDNIDGINSNFVAYSTQNETATATQGQTIFTLTGIQYIPATNSLAVYVNGSKQILTLNYIETSSTVVTFVDGLNVGDVVQFTTAVATSTNVVDASNVSYNEGDTGAIDNNVQDRLRQYVSVKDFGAVGDGVTDDTDAINNALASGKGTIFFPAGEYAVSDTLNVASNTTLQGTSNSQITQTADNTTTILIDGCTDVVVNTLILNGKGITDTCSVAINTPSAVAFGIHITDSNNVWVQNCNVLQFKRVGILTDTSNNIWIENNIVVGCGPDPDVPNGSTTVFTGGIVIDENGVSTISYYNINIIGNRVSYVHDCLFAAPGYGNVLIQNNFFSNASNHTAYCYPGVDWLIDSNFFDTPYSDGFKFQWYADGTSSGDYIPANLTFSNNNFTNVPVGNWCIDVFVIDVVTTTPIKFRKEFRNVNVVNNVMRTAGRGISLSSTINGVITGNTLVGNQVGIRTTDFAGLISNNYIFGVGVNPLISLAHWKYVTYIKDNIIEGGGQTTSVSAYIEAYNFQGFSPWQPNDIYTVSDVVSNGSNVYSCVQQGVSASSGGPTGTGTNIVDGTVLWDYAGAVSSYGGGRISIQGNKTNYISGTQVVYALYANDSTLVLDAKDNVFPLTRSDGTTASTYRTEATMVTLEDNIHGGYFGGTLPTITPTTTGKPFRDFIYGSAPATGTWALGDRVWNSSPTAGGVLMWVCTTAGTPGTWKAVAIAA